MRRDKQLDILVDVKWNTVKTQEHKEVWAGTEACNKTRNSQCIQSNCLSVYLWRQKRPASYFGLNCEEPGLTRHGNGYHGNREGNSGAMSGGTQ